MEGKRKDGTLKKGYRYAKGGRVVKASSSGTKRSGGRKGRKGRKAPRRRIV
jgi:hypothetical protein